MANPSELKFWEVFPSDGEGLRLKHIRIRGTVSWKIACILYSILATLAVNFILFSMNLNVFGRLVGGGEINK